MPKQRDLTPLVRAVGSVITEHVGKAFSALADRIDGLEAKLTALPTPKDGIDGKSVTVDELRPVIKDLVDEIPKPKDGIDGTSVTADEIAPLLVPTIEAKAAEVALQAIAELPRPKDGIDGKSVTPEDILPTVKDWFDALPKPKDGTDGKSVTVDDVSEFMEAAMAKWALEFERRASDLIQRCIDRIPKPKDGEKGKDGRDAFDLEDIHAEFADDGRTLTLAWVRGEDRVERQLTLPHVIYRGVHQQGKQYQRGDSVTFQGSMWIAMRDTGSKPETDDSWRLAVKRGRDGKDGQKGDKGERGAPAKVERF